MARERDVVRAAGGGPLLKVEIVFQDMARCLWFDDNGRVHHRWHYLHNLEPWYRTIGAARTSWPEASELAVFAEDEAQAPKAPSKFRKVVSKEQFRRKKRMKVQHDARTVDIVLDEITDWRNGKLWGAGQIAKFASVSTDTVKRWAKDPTCPITQPSGFGRYFCTKGDLMGWLREKKRRDMPEVA